MYKSYGYKDESQDDKHMILMAVKLYSIETIKSKGMHNDNIYFGEGNLNLIIYFRNSNWI